VKMTEKATADVLLCNSSNPDAVSDLFRVFESLSKVEFLAVQHLFHNESPSTSQRTISGVPKRLDRSESKLFASI
jgi:hypothetical protein